MKHFKSWAEDGLQNIIPPNAGEFPEGEAAINHIVEHCVGSIGRNFVVEFGCGRGRLAGFFDYYYGYDGNDKALAIASDKNPGCTFVTWKPFDKLETGDACLAHTVLLHIEDEALPKYIKVLTDCAPKVIVSEIMLREVRNLNHADRPAYSRDLEDYVQLFKKRKFNLTSSEQFNYERYNKPLTVAVFEKNKD